jgi:serine protease AprX
MEKRMRGLYLALSFFVVINLLSPIAYQSPRSELIRAHAQLITAAASTPAQIVQVIVQVLPGVKGVEKLVLASGGRIVSDLAIINAISVEMPAGRVIELAANPAVKWVSPDAAVKSSACTQCVDTTKLANAYIAAIHADVVWNTAPYIQGKAIGVAVIDSGVNPNGDLYTTMGVNRQVADIRFNSDFNQSVYDGYGHGTHVASIVGGDGSESSGQYIGVAPMANIINVKVSNDDGSAAMADIVRGLQWVLENKAKYNIRVVNLSLNSTVAESYQTSPLDAAVEILWFNGVVVVVSAGNKGSNAIYPPANDPFVITVGATDDKGTGSISDDAVASFSAYGKTENGAVKPDLVAPGKNIVARLVNMNMGLAGAHPGNVVNNQYFRMSGTSMAAPMVSGAVALLLQDEPDLTPDQVKFRLMTTANKAWAGYSAGAAGAGYLDVAALVKGSSTQSANTGIKASSLLTTGSQPITWGSVGWNSVGWNSVGWNSVGWNSVGWNSVGWNSDYWGQ